MATEQLKVYIPDLHIPRIALIGTACVGKTKVINYVRQRYTRREVAALEEQAGLYFKAHPDITDAYASDTQGQIMEWIIAAEQTAEADRPRVIVSDLAPISAPTYVAFGGDYEGAERLYGRIASSLSVYSFLLFDPTGVPYCSNSIRHRLGMEPSRLLIHEEYIRFLDEHAIPYQLVAGSLEERIAHVQAAIDEHLGESRLQ